MKDIYSVIFMHKDLTLGISPIEFKEYALTREKVYLPQYKLKKHLIDNHAPLSIPVKTGSPNDCIEGILIELSQTELKATDLYLTKHYKRVLKTVSSGQQAWVYTAKNEIPLSTIANNIHAIRTRIKNACAHSNRQPQEVKLLLATKTVDSTRIKEAFQCNETLIAENKVQEVKQKYPDLRNISFQQHFIGHLQTNKVKEILKYNITCIQSLDRIGLAEKLQNRLVLEDKTMDVFIQVNTSNEHSKFGIPPDEAVHFVKQVAKLDRLNIKGLMTIGLFSSNLEKVRSCFKKLKHIQQEVVRAQIANVEMKELSMGMSGDLEVAIEEGATIIRVGTAIFGERQYPDSYYWDEQLDMD